MVTRALQAILLKYTTHLRCRYAEINARRSRTATDGGGVNQ